MCTLSRWTDGLHKNSIMIKLSILLMFSFRIYKIRIQKPSGITESSLEDDPEVSGRKKVTLQWYPTTDDIGKHPVCYSALDSER